MLNTKQIEGIENFIQHMLIQTVRLLPLAETTTDKVAKFINNIFQMNEKKFKELFDEPVSSIMQISLNHLKTEYDRGYQSLGSTQQETQEALHSLVNNPDIYLLIAERMFVAENYQEAIKSWTQYNTLTHNNPNEVLYNVALAEAKLEQHRASLIKFISILQMNPLNSSTKAKSLHNMGVIYAKTGKLELALRKFQETLAITPNAPDTLRCYSRVQSLTHQESPKTFFATHGFWVTDTTSTGGSSSTAQNIEPSNSIRPSSN